MNWNPKAKRVARIVLIILVALLFVCLSMCVALSNDPNHTMWPIETDEPNVTNSLNPNQIPDQPTQAPTPTESEDVSPKPTEFEQVDSSGEMESEPVETSKQPIVVNTPKPSSPVNQPQHSKWPNRPSVEPSTEPPIQPSTAPSSSPSPKPSEALPHLVIKIKNETSVYGECIKELHYTVVQSAGISLAEIEPHILLFKQAGTNVGSYVTTGTCTNPNWDVTFQDGTYTITKRPITVKIDSKSSYVGSNLQELTSKIESGTLAQGDKLSNIVQLSTTANKNKAGSYSIVGTVSNPNYNVIFKKGIYSVQNRGNSGNEPLGPIPTETVPISTPRPTPPPAGGNGNTESGNGNSEGNGGIDIEGTPAPTATPTPTPTPRPTPPPAGGNGNTESGNGNSEGNGGTDIEGTPAPTATPTPRPTPRPTPPPAGGNGNTESGNGNSEGNGSADI